jgi:hypothetical protein
MNLATAHLIDLESKRNNHLIVSGFTFDTQEEAFTRSENLIHNKRKQMREAYYKYIVAIVLKYDYVLLFG